MRRTRSQRALALLPALLLLAGATGCARVLYNFGQVEHERILRSAQPSPLFLRWLVHEHRIKTLVNLRGDTDGFESAFAARHGLRLFSFDMSASRPPSDQDVRRFLEIVSDPENQPVLVHCRNGVDRTGYMLGLYRLTEQGWRADRAAREMNRYWQFSFLNGVPQRVVKEGLRAD